LESTAIIINQIKRLRIKVFMSAQAIPSSKEGPDRSAKILEGLTPTRDGALKKACGAMKSL